MEPPEQIDLTNLSDTTNSPNDLIDPRTPRNPSNQAVIRYKCELMKHFNFIREDWRRRIVLQIKQAMTAWKNNVDILIIKKQMYRKAKTIKNFWKPISLEDQKYYHKPSGIIVVDRDVRIIIDFLVELGLRWSLKSTEWIDPTMTEQYDKLIATWYHQDFLSECDRYSAE